MDQNQCIELIELYRDYEVLWNAKFKDYHNRNKKEDAWKDISAQMNIPVYILKAKMKSLSGTFRSEKSRETKKTTGSGTDNVYVSKWFAYKYFDFLSDKNTPRETINSMNATMGSMSENQQEEEIGATAEPTLGNTDTISSDIVSPNTSGKQQGTKQRRSVKKKKVDEDEDSQLIKESFEILKSSVDVMSDPYNSYGQYIGNELRKYDGHTLALVKRAFSNILFNADMGMLSYTNTEPQYFMPEAAPQRYGSSSSAEYSISHGSPWTTSTQHSVYDSNLGSSQTPTPSSQPTVSQLLPSTTDETPQDQNNPETSNLLFKM